jgi:hypothetical protein
LNTEKEKEEREKERRKKKVGFGSTRYKGKRIGVYELG